MNRSHLDALADRFAETKDNNAFNEFMMELENSLVMVPAKAPANVTEETMEAAKKGAPIPIDLKNPPQVMLMPKKDGGLLFPVFTSPQHIPEDKKPPVIVNLPFSAVIDLLKKNEDKVSEIIVNPFTKYIILTDKLVDLVDKRIKAGVIGQRAQNVQLTEQQIHAIAHVKMSREELPKALFEDPKKVLSDIRLGKEKYVMDAYRKVYPPNIKPPYTEDDISVMSLQIDEDMLITRIDLPEKYTQEGSPLRIYIAEHDSEIGYYMIEKGGKDSPGYIASVAEDGTHTKIEEAPDNGAEIEAIMSLIRPS
ncbi:SseB protein N-terminal domain-containing protein [Lachnospiraceae bacterium XBB2008]|nr:SseB protein N-terminal domain-containing protein [Lachnospiraceae bacterium XBB2008]